ncbi:DUF2637 domain-containing protein [Streptomyces sp. MBT56]|uniref:DUF2637 domain-containing protein n=1 Tax=unclassified Streptomyces TaxID=2593676 RepID=UPI00190B4D58|nr:MULTISPECIES: DUF2637 domain-containing protein [unclassified Streptomyces]MBK3559777.1 DUF2637 domain-containing protein [Streptomyces sp. MBT56]MBK3601281.1 DUF2637 domain-containing protein [Streptomyces sp. MBT54]MBK3615272.1 DUF2637 domain-containing protein [Streptomyces sp. MBT98]
MTTESKRRLDVSTYAGMLAVAVAAAVLSFSALAGLAELAGVSGEVLGFKLAWLLPIAIDAYAVTATRVWLRNIGMKRVTQYARSNAVGAISLSVAGNGAYHFFASTGVTSLATMSGGWLVVVTVSAVPPAILGLVGHLHALVAAEGDEQAAPRTREGSLDHHASAGVHLEADDQPASAFPVDVPDQPPLRAATEPATNGGSSDALNGDFPGRLQQPKTGTTTQQRPAGKPPGTRVHDGNSGAVEKKMRDHWAAERAEGRTPSGADLDRAAGTRDYGRKVRRALLAEEAVAPGDGAPDSK